MRLLKLLVVAAAALAASSADAGARKAAVLPGWSLVGTYDLQVPTGFASLAGDYTYQLYGQDGSIRFAYDAKARVQAIGTLGLGTLVAYSGTFTVGDDGVQHLTLSDNPKNPVLRFEGDVAPDARSIVGSTPVGQGSEAVTFVRLTPATVPQTFRLQIDTTMDRRGFVRGRRGSDHKEALARLDTFDGRTFAAGRIRGRVVTQVTDGPTTAAVTVRGRGWSADLVGPVDESGFHASVSVRAGGFVVTSSQMVLPVQPGPEPPPPPPPPPPKNLLGRGVATLSGGHVTMSRTNAPSRFFGTTCTVTVEFEIADLSTPVHATPANATGTTPRRFYVRIGNRIYGTASAPGDVLIEARRLSPPLENTFEVLCTGQVADVNGRTKPVDVLFQGTIAP